MATTVTPVNVTTDTFETWVTRSNTLIDLMSLYVVTANNEANGSLTTGNGFVNGIFGANTIVIPGELRGGNVQSSQALVIGQSASQNNSFTYTIGNSTVNSFANSLVLRIGSATSNIQIDEDNINLGTATVNLQINTTSVTIQNATDAITVVAPTAAQSADGGYFLNADGNWTLSSGVETETTTTGTSAQEIDSFLKATYRSGEFVISVTDNDANAYQIAKILAIHDDHATDSDIVEYGVTYSNTNLGSFAGAANATHVLINFTPTSSNTTVKSRKTLITV
jgi:hypothetical protein